MTEYQDDARTQFAFELQLELWPRGPADLAAAVVKALNSADVAPDRAQTKVAQHTCVMAVLTPQCIPNLAKLSCHQTSLRSNLKLQVCGIPRHELQGNVGISSPFTLATPATVLTAANKAAYYARPQQYSSLEMLFQWQHVCC